MQKANKTKKQTNKTNKTDKMNFSKLPKEIINIILELNGYHVYRHGKYMIQLGKNDPRYTILQKKPSIKKNEYGSWEAKLFQIIHKQYYVYTIYTFEHSGYLHWCLDLDVPKEKTDDKDNRKNIHYVFGRHPKQNRPIKHENKPLKIFG